MPSTPALRRALTLLAFGLAPAFTTLACAGRVAQPLTAARVDGSARGFQHELAAAFEVLCEVREGHLRCRGMHPLMLDESAAWMSYGDGFSRASVGGFIVCALREGRVLCWGGDPVDSSSSPSAPLYERFCSEQTFSDLEGVREVGMVEEGGCVITQAGEARCWGAPLGDEYVGDSSIQDVARGARGLSVGAFMGCAVSEGRLLCWGDTVGVDDDVERPLDGSAHPVSIPEPEQVVVGDSFACARSADRRVFCWGYDFDGELGLGAMPADDERDYPPRALPDLRAVDLVASERSVCARALDGRTLCWGSNVSGQLGLGHTRRVNRPTHVPALDNALDVALGPESICARFEGGAIRCAGDLTSILPGADTWRMPARRLPGSTEGSLLLAAHSTCLASEAGVRCYGGVGPAVRGHEEAAAGWALPVAEPGALTHLALESGEGCYRWRDGRVRCEWSASEALEMSGTHDLDATSYDVCVVDAARRVRCFPRSRSTATPDEVPGVVDADRVRVTYSRACAIQTNGGLTCWSLRPGDHPDGTPPGPTSAPSDIRDVALSVVGTCVLRVGGELLCWEGDAPLRSEIDGVAALASSGGTIYVVQGGLVRAVRTAGGATTLADPTPGLRDVVELRGAGRHLCARNQTGEIWCWGSNDDSQLGVLRPTLRLAFTELGEAMAEPEHPAMLQCGPADMNEYDEYDEYDGYDEEEGYEEDD